MEQWGFEHIKWLMSLGIGGILAGLIFLVYRKDMMAWKKEKNGLLDEAKLDRKILLEALTNNTMAITQIKDSLEVNTRALDHNTTALVQLQMRCQFANRPPAL